LLAPTGVPPEIIRRLAEACNEAVRSPDVIAPLALQGFDTLQGIPEAFADFIKTDRPLVPRRRRGGAEEVGRRG
jgi:tripartite-type tricarboxylate transporter receptor subunit TctC